ncbi:MAG: ATP-binding protein, partial [Myxococcota bacterium]
TLAVADNGPGVPQEIAARVFEPMFSTKPMRGSGLGLAVCRDLVQAMGGTITLHAGPRGGTVFRVRLSAGSAERAAPPTPPRAPVASWGRGAPKNILVVDDEPFLAKSTARALAPHHVVAVDNADAALEAASSTVFDAVVTDLMMPGRSGVDLYNALEQQHPALARHVLFVSGGVFGPAMAEAVAASGRPVVAKPWTMSELRSAVSRMLDSRDGDAHADAPSPEEDPVGGVGAVVKSLFAAAREVASADRWSVVLADEQGRVVTQSVFCEGSGGADQPVSAGTKVRAVLRTRVPAVTPLLDPRDADSRQLYALGIRSTVVVPISNGDAAIATLNGGSMEPDAYTSETAAALANLCARFGPVLDRARRHWLSRVHADVAVNLGVGSHYLLRPEAVLQRLSRAVLVTDVDGRIVWTNHAANTLLGIGADARSDQVLSELFAVPDRPHLEQPRVRTQERMRLALQANARTVTLEATREPIVEEDIWLGTQWTLREVPDRALDGKAE